MTVVPLPERPDDLVRKAQLVTMKRRATSLLVVAAAVFVAAKLAELLHPGFGFVRAAAEAAMIGGFADWFAVTALFRHPLGIPIPHTAIIPARKDRLGRTLGNFVQNHFLSREVLSQRLRQIGIVERLALWLSDPANCRTIARQVAAGLAKTVEAMPDSEMRGLVYHAVVGRLRKTQVAPLLGNVLSLVQAGDKHQELLSEVIKLTAKTVDENRDVIRERVKTESPWWVPGIVDDKVYRKILVAIETLLQDIGTHPDHPLRAKFDKAIERFVDQLQHSPEVIAKAEGLKGKLLDDPMVEELSGWIWDSTRGAVVDQAARAGDGAPTALERGISAFSSSLLGNPELLARAEAMVIEGILGAVEQYRNEVSELIATTVAHWDAEATSRRIELAVGKDLQFIRINGTLVGGLVGLLLYTLSYFWH